MSDNLPAPSGAALAALRQTTADFIAASKAQATRRAYDSDWRDFESWCAGHGMAALPAAPENVALYLGALADKGLKVATVRRRCAALADRHGRAGLPNPAAHPGVKATLAGIARSLGARPRKKAALTADLLHKALRKIPRDLAGTRDRALILTGFAGALRRSELVGLDCADIERLPQGLVLTLRRSKTDQAGRGATKAIPRGRRLDAIAALDAWLAAARIASGPLFRGVQGATVLPGRLSSRQAARIVQARAAALGLDAKAFGGHSLRSGFISSAAEHGASLQAIAGHAGHQKLDTTMGYVQVRDAFKNHAGKGFL